MKRPVTSLCRRPGKKPPAGQPVPGAGTISAHGDALRRAVRSAGQKTPGRGLKNSPRRRPGAVRRLRHGGTAGNGRCLVPVSCRTLGARRGRGHTRRKNSPRRGPGTVCRLRPWGNGGQWGCLVPGRHRSGRPPGQRVRPGAKTAPGGAGGCLDAGYGCYLPRAIRVIWMHRVGSTARPRIMPS